MHFRKISNVNTTKVMIGYLGIKLLGQNLYMSYFTVSINYVHFINFSNAGSSYSPQNYNASTSQVFKLV